MKHYLYLLIFLLAFFSCKKKNNKNEIEKNFKLPYFNSHDFTPDWKQGTHKIPEFSFTNQNRKTITNNTFKNKIYVADFFFTSCPGICPKLTKNMKTLQDFYKNDDAIMLLSHTVMPWRDSVPILKRYATKHHAIDTKWHLVTGDKNDLYKIARQGYFADENFINNKNEEDFIHTENFVLIDKKGFIRGVYNGTIGIDIDRLKRHIEILKKE